MAVDEVVWKGERMRSGPELGSRGGKGKGVASCVCVLFCVSVPASRFSELAGLYPFGDHVSLLSLSAQGFYTNNAWTSGRR